MVDDHCGRVHSHHIYSTINCALDQISRKFTTLKIEGIDDRKCDSLSTACFVDAARVNPDILPPIQLCLSTALLDLEVTRHFLAFSILQIL